MSPKPQYLKHDSNYAWQHGINYRKNPHLYQIGRGQQGVAICEPYKSELIIHWRFKTPEQAQTSAQTIYHMFLNYLKQDDFVGADMAKKHLHMGYTRSRRYANHVSGTKWQQLSNGDWKILPLAKNRNSSPKAQSAEIFYQYWKQARTHSDYLKQKENHKQLLAKL